MLLLLYHSEGNLNLNLHFQLNFFTANMIFLFLLLRETDWMFGTIEGRNYLRDSTGHDRLAVITFHRNQNYGTLNEVQDELRQTILQLAPPFMSFSSNSQNIPYLTLEDGMGHRETIFTGTSTYSGDLLVEDVTIDNEIFRRLIFLNNQSVVQSEAKMKKGKPLIV